MGIKDIPGVIIETDNQFGLAFTQAMTKQRFWERPSYFYYAYNNNQAAIGRFSLFPMAVCLKRLFKTNMS